MPPWGLSSFQRQPQASGLLAELGLLCLQQMPTPRLLEQKTGRDYSSLSKTALGKAPHSPKLVKWQDV